MNERFNKKKDRHNPAQNSEKFIAFPSSSLQVKDSFSFLSSSRDKLVRLNKYDNDKKLDKWTEHFKFTNSNPYVKNDHDLDLLTEKRVYTYVIWLIWLYNDYMTDFSKFDETELPSKKAFYSYV